jgi:hypothetical protein
MGRAEVEVQLQTMLHSLLLCAELGMEHGVESEARHAAEICKAGTILAEEEGSSNGQAH